MWDDEGKGEGETRCRHIAYSCREAPSGMPGLTSSSDGRFGIKSAICLFNICIDPGGPVIIILATGSQGSRVQTRPGLMHFSERKNTEYDFLRKGSKAMGSMSAR